MEKILDIVDSIAHEKGLEPEKVRDALRDAYVKTAKKVIDEKYNFDTVVDEQSKQILLFQKIEVVADDNELLANEDEKEKFISLKEAKKIDNTLDIGDEVTYEITLEGFGRTGAMTLHHEVEYQIQRLVEDNVFEKYKNKVGKLVTGSVVRIDGADNTYIEIDEMRAVLPKKFRIKNESFKVGDVIKTIVKNVFINQDGMQIILSRTTPKFLEALLNLEVPEISDGSVVIEKSARIPGRRAKVALYSNRENIDPVGAAVGVKGVRINAVSNEILGESIDVINYSPIPEIFLARSMAPAIVNSVVINEDIAKITISSDQKAKAIGKDGINIRLASMLTGLNIELVEIESSKDIEGSPDVSENLEPMLSSLFKD